jgi:hypothetical protein
VLRSERLREAHRLPEQSAVDLEVGGRRMCEAHRAGRPLGSQKQAQEAVRGAHGQFDGVAAHAGRGQKLLRQHGDAVRLLEPGHQVFVVLPAVAHQGGDGLAQRRLVTRQHADQPQGRST